MASIEEPEVGKIIELPYPVEVKGESLTVQLSRVIIVNVIGYLAGKVAERAFDRIVVSRVNSFQVKDIKELNA